MTLIIIASALFALILALGWNWQARKEQAIVEEENELLKGILEDVEEEERESGEVSKRRVPAPVEQAASKLRQSRLMHGPVKEDVLYWLDKKLVHSGMNNPVEPGRQWSAPDVLSYYIVGEVGILILGAFLFLVTPIPPWILALWLLGMLFFPYKLLQNKVKKRQETALFQLDKFLDELDLVLSNGRTQLDDAIIHTVAHQRSQRRKDPVLAREFDYAYRQWSAGKDRSEALRDVGRRIGVFQITAVIENMVQNLEKGTSARETVRSQADQAKAMIAEEMRTMIAAADQAFTASMAMSLAGVTIILFGALLMGILQGAGSIT